MKSKKTAIVLLSLITVMVVMHSRELETLFREENQVQVLAKMGKMATEFQLKFGNTEEKGTSLSRQGRHEELRYGEVVYGTEHVIIYNSVPKCGSRTFGATSRKIFYKRSINFTRYNLRHENRPEKEKRRSRSEIKRLIKGVKTPSYVQGHALFVPFDENPRPVYINFIRDPVSRMVSAFYFTRFGDGKLNGVELTEKIKNMSMEECILGGHETCTRPGRYPEIFCGFNPRCRKNPIWALEQAKSNIDKYYTFIGITEDYEASLRVLEHLMPDMYNGTTELYLSLLKEENSVVESTKTNNKQPLSQELNDTVTELLAVDYELYNYIKEKHRDLKVQFGID